jgi:adenylate cyclase
VADERRRPVLERAVERAANHVRRHPTSPRALYLGAGPLFELGRREEALRWLDRALQIDPDKADVQYNVACVLAVAGETERAIGHVRRAMECGYMGMEWMAVDPDLESLRDDPRFLAITEEYRSRG